MSWLSHYFIVVDVDMTKLGGTIHRDRESAVEDARIQSLQNPGVDYVVLTNVASAKDGKTKVL